MLSDSLTGLPYDGCGGGEPALRARVAGLEAALAEARASATAVELAFSRLEERCIGGGGGGGGARVSKLG